MRHLQGRTNLLQKSDGEVDAFLLGGGQAIPPLAELIGELDLPGHSFSMSCTALCRQGYRPECRLAFVTVNRQAHRVMSTVRGTFAAVRRHILSVPTRSAARATFSCRRNF